MKKLNRSTLIGGDASRVFVMCFIAPPDVALHQVLDLPELQSKLPAAPFFYLLESSPYDFFSPCRTLTACKLTLVFGFDLSASWLQTVVRLPLTWFEAGCNVVINDDYQLLKGG